MWKMVSHIKEEHRLSVFEKRMLRKISGPKKKEGTGG
jgi:predicted small metal-binding protein